jgi:hypothetical protein
MERQRGTIDVPRILTNFTSIGLTVRRQVAIIRLRWWLVLACADWCPSSRCSPYWGWASCRASTFTARGPTTGATTHFCTVTSSRTTRPTIRPPLTPTTMTRAWCGLAPSSRRSQRSTSVVRRPMRLLRRLRLQWRLRGRQVLSIDTGQFQCTVRRVTPSTLLAPLPPVPSSLT